MKDKSNIILIGMPGSGKSTIGVILAKALGMDFIDTDLLICRTADSTLQNIISSHGSKYFLDLEESIVCSLSPQSTVIATGGSVPLRSASVSHLKSLGSLIYLETPLHELKKRLYNITTRGIVFAPGETLKSLYLSRCPVYESSADYTIHTAAPDSYNTTEYTVEQIIRLLHPEIPIIQNNHLF